MVNSIDFDVPGLSDGNLLKHFVFEIESLYFFSAFQQYGNLLNRFAIEIESLYFFSAFQQYGNLLKHFVFEKYQ